MKVKQSCLLYKSCNKDNLPLQLSNFKIHEYEIKRSSSIKFLWLTKTLEGEPYDNGEKKCRKF